MQSRESGRVAFIVVIAAWCGILAMMLTRTLYIAQDSLSNDAHVWWIADRVWNGHGLPLHVPLADGKAFAFPYGFVPWMTAALLWPLVGSWSVTVCIVIGFVALVVSMFWAFPELGRGWWAALVMVQPTLVISPLIGQLPFLWAMAFAFAGIGLWRRQRRFAATAAVAMALVTHVAVMAPIILLLVLGWSLWEPNRVALWRATGCAMVCAVPAAVFVVRSPVFGESSFATKAYSVANTVGPRSVVLLIPILVTVLVSLERRGRLSSWVAPAACAVVLSGNVVFAPAFDTAFAVGALWRTPDHAVDGLLRSPAFVGGETIRVLRAGDGKLAMYQVLRAGGILDSEFFPESFGRRRYADEAVYSAELRRRGVDLVVVFDSFEERFQTGEQGMLKAMAAADLRADSRCSESNVGVSEVFAGRDFKAFRIQREC